MLRWPHAARIDRYLQICANSLNILANAHNLSLLNPGQLRVMYAARRSQLYKGQATGCARFPNLFCDLGGR